MDDTPISAAEQAEADLFYQALGRAIGQWSVLEYYLGLMFRVMTNMEEVVARNVFHSARSWRARYDMLSGALSASAGPPGAVASWSVVVETANKYSAFRNVLAHDHVQMGAQHKESGQRYLCIRRGVHPLENTGNEPWYHRGHIEAAGRNFALLGALVTQAISHPRDDQLGSPERLIWLASQLPNPPHSGTVDPTVAAQFELGLKRQPFPR